VKVTYVLITSLPYIMGDVTRVFVGSSGLLKNGFLMNRVGTGQVCCVASNFKVPVIVCVEAYKFCENVQIDSICYNEIGVEDELIST
jgi:translation initiation factor eIF-2B subunit delta